MNPTCHQEEILIATHPSQRLYLKVIGTVGPVPRTKKSDNVFFYHFQLRTWNTIKTEFQQNMHY